MGRHTHTRTNAQQRKLPPRAVRAGAEMERVKRVCMQMYTFFPRGDANAVVKLDTKLFNAIFKPHNITAAKAVKAGVPHHKINHMSKSAKRRLKGTGRVRFYVAPRLETELRFGAQPEEGVPARCLWHEMKVGGKVCKVTALPNSGGLCFAHKRAAAVEIGDSTVPGAGKGLFARRNIPAGQHVTPMLGYAYCDDEDGLAERERAAGHGEGNAYVHPDGRLHLANAANCCLARYANHKPRSQANAEFVNFNGRMWIKTKSDIAKGDEIFVTYNDRMHFK